MSDRDLLERLVAFDTTSSRPNVPIVDFICEYLDRPGVRCERFPVAEGKENLVIEAGPASSSNRGLTLSGHLDCVPAGEGWTADPFTLSEVDGRYVARGACDMKGFVALAVNTVAAAPSSWAAPLALVLTCDEEIGGIGAKSLVEAWPADRTLPRSTVIGEPTMLSAVRMHKGHLKFRLSRRGRPAHSGSPHLGDNAVDSSGRVLTMLQRLGEDFGRMRTAASEVFPSVPHPVLCVVGVEAGIAWNVVPETCEIRCSLRVLPDQSPSEVIAEIERALAGLLDHDHAWSLDIFNDNPPLCTAADTIIHQNLCQLMGQDRSMGVSFCSDGGHLSRMGLDCVLWGPGSIEQAHLPDEFLDADQFAKGRDALDELVIRMCGGAE